MKLIIRRKVFYSIILISLLLLIAAFGLAYYFYYQYKNLKLEPQKYSQAEAEKVVEEVSKLMILPQDEQPTVATVSDPSALRSQAFFLHAQQGDKVLIYAAAGKAILYNPSEHKIIEVAPIDLGAQKAVQTPVSPALPTASTTKPVKK